jgi:hypothetical protein
MIDIAIKDGAGVLRDYTYEKLTGKYNLLSVDQFEIRAKNDTGAPYMIPVFAGSL